MDVIVRPFRRQRRIQLKRLPRHSSPHFAMELMQFGLEPMFPDVAPGHTTLEIDVDRQDPIIHDKWPILPD